MNIAPQPILQAAMRVLHVAAYTTRNWTLESSSQGSRQQINDLWEAVHEIPWVVLNWYGDEDELVGWLDFYASKWQEPRLRAIYEQAKAEHKP